VTLYRAEPKQQKVNKKRSEKIKIKADNTKSRFMKSSVLADLLVYDGNRKDL